MRKLPFVPPEDFYLEELRPLDEQLCELLKRRKEISDGKPGFPPAAYIMEWAEKYGFYEDFLNYLFRDLREEEAHRPFVEPHGFRKHLPVMKSVELDDKMYSITFIRQYENASVLMLIVDWEEDEEDHLHHQMVGVFDLSVGPEFDCRFQSGRGSGGQSSKTFLISPPLPDDLSGKDFSFQGRSYPFAENQFEVNFTIRME